MISHLLEIHWIIQRTIPVTCPGNPSFLDSLFKHCDTAFQTFSTRYTVLSPTLQSSPGIQSCLIPISFCEICVSPSLHKKGLLKVIANFLLPNSVVYLPPVLYEAFYTISQASSTCSPAFCPIIMLSLDSLEVLLLLHWAFCPPSLII